MVRPLLFALVLLAAPGTAHAAPPGDPACGFAIAEDLLDPEREREYVVMHGGPVAQNGTLTCTIKVGVQYHDQPAQEGASVSATGSAGVTVIPPTPVTFRRPAEANVYLCDQFTDSSGTTWYYDDVSESWTTNAAARCPNALTAD